MKTLESDLWLPASIDRVWNFASKVENLVKISPKNFPVEIEGHPLTENGVRQKILISPFGLPLPIEWIAAISEVQSTGPKRQFVDTQEKGPFAHWKHQHIFESGDSTIHGYRSDSEIKVVEAGTWVRDRVEYKAAFGILGNLADGFFLRKQLENLFAFRREKLWQEFGQKFGSSKV